MNPPDVLIPVRIPPLTDARSENLRHCLRAVHTHIDYGRIVITGHRPPWLRTDDRLLHIHVTQTRDKQTNTLRCLTAALRYVGDDILLWNDDFFPLHPIRSIPSLSSGPLRTTTRRYVDHHPNSRYTARLLATLGRLVVAGVDDPLCFELHLPMAVNREPFAETLRWCETQPSLLLWRSLYGNRYADRTEHGDDVKIYDDSDIPAGTSFVSTSAWSFTHGTAGRTLRALYPTPSPFEINRRRRHK